LIDNRVTRGKLGAFKNSLKGGAAQLALPPAKKNKKTK
jgi:hypothetical protein